MATLLKLGQELMPGAIMFGSQFLGSHCMLHSLLLSWVDCISQAGALSEYVWSKTIETCLVAMVQKALAVSGPAQLHDADPEDIISLASMALLFIGKGQEKEILCKVLGLLAQYQASHPDVYAKVQHQFEELKDANSPEHPHSQPFRNHMKKAVDHLLQASF